eukprot:TRINITY_DN0_c0_g1_i1.p1 TRINITY_DN0_c0_g1~~TRINITY_DN0_c0_g1_i1.p1  ORF type:complete len:760 (-),score=142.76 TRINITY_DN0_c0_g1_i1:32-2056(-)
MTDVNTKPWGVFEEIKGEKFFDFQKVREKIDWLTDQVAGKKKGIVDRPIILTIYSHTCPDLTLIDLPGITRIPLAGSDQPADIEKITKSMCHRYVKDTRTIILCVIPANQDLTTSEALMMARHLDPNGIRTLGVITKIDIMDKGTNAKRMLLGQEVPLRLGFVGVKNRSQQDINDNMRVQKALFEERKFFSTHPIYSTLPTGHLGTDVLSGKLTKVLYTHIRHHLPEIMREIQDRMKEVSDRLKDIGPDIPMTDEEKMMLVWSMVTDFCILYKNTIKGQFDLKRGERKNSKELTGGAKVKMNFYNLFKEFDNPKYKATNEYSDRDIERAIILHEGDNLPGFPSADVFIYLIQPQLEKLKEPAIDCLNDVYSYLDQLASELSEKTFARFPSLGDEVLETVQMVLMDERDKTRYLVESVIESEQGYMFTNDPDYLKNRTDIIPTNTPGMDAKEQKKADPANIYVMEMRARLEAYFKIVLKNVRDLIPKLIGNILVRGSDEQMQFKLYTKIAKQTTMISHLLGEPPAVANERKNLNTQLGTLRGAIGVLRRDPDLASSLAGTDSELYQLLQEEKSREKEQKQRDKEAMMSREGRESIVQSQPPPTQHIPPQGAMPHGPGGPHGPPHGPPHGVPPGARPMGPPQGGFPPQQPPPGGKKQKTPLFQEHVQIVFTNDSKN